MQSLPDGTVLDGEIVAWKDARVLPFSDLQRRIGRKKLTEKMLRDVPAAFIAFDILENGGADRRSLPLTERRALLEEVAGGFFSQRIVLSTRVEAESWERIGEIRATSRDRHVEGFMLKRLDSDYVGGRVTGVWWKWKIAPFSCDAVLIYAQRGHGRRASLYSDYTFGVWHGNELVPFAKAYSGLTDEEIHEVDHFVRRNTIERFGPVHAVRPELVFELAFDGIQLSTRHKSGIAVRFPRMARWRRDKKPVDADSLDSVKALMPLTAD
jgi:DNA ligase-1